MSEPDYYLCDVCGEKLPKEARFDLNTGYIHFVAGGGYEACKQPVDLCHKHLAMLVGLVVAGFKINNGNPDKPNNELVRRAFSHLRTTVSVVKK